MKREQDEHSVTRSCVTDIHQSSRFLFTLLVCVLAKRSMLLSFAEAFLFERNDIGHTAITIYTPADVECSDLSSMALSSFNIFPHQWCNRFVHSHSFPRWSYRTVWIVWYSIAHVPRRRCPSWLVQRIHRKVSNYYSYVHFPPVVDRTFSGTRRSWH